MHSDFLGIYSVIHLCAPNDRNGNPRRCYLVSSAENMTAYDEGYKGRAAIPKEVQNRILINMGSASVPVSEYKETLRYIGTKEAQEAVLRDCMSRGVLPTNT